MEKTAKIFEDYSLTDTRKFYVEADGKSYFVTLPAPFNSIDPIVSELKNVTNDKKRANLILLCQRYAAEREPKRAEVSE